MLELRAGRGLPDAVKALEALQTLVAEGAT
jgi:hypothetical protein